MTRPEGHVVVGGETESKLSFDREYTVVYDGNCRVCTKLSKLLIKWDRHDRLQVVPSQFPGLKQAFPFIPENDYHESMQLIGPGNQRWQAGAAVEQLLEVLPRGALISWIFKLPFVRAFTDRFYRWFARNRYKLGCGEHCDYKARSKTGMH